MRLFGPVFHKELLELSRRPTSFYLRAVTGGALLVAFLIYAQGDYRSLPLSITKRQAAIGESIFEGWMWIQFWVVCGAMPLLVAGLVSAEREAGSLELLFTTHLTDREIVLGKLASRLVFVVLLVFSALPVLVITGLLGGIDFDRLFKLYLMTGSAALLVAAVGVYFSVVSKRPWIACLKTYLFFAFFWAVVPFTVLAVLNAMSVSGPVTPNRVWFFNVLVETAPYLGVYALTGNTPGFIVASVSWDRVLMHCASWVGFATIFLFVAVRRLRRGPNPSKRRKTVSTVPESVGRRRWRLFQPSPLASSGRRREVLDPDGQLWRLQCYLWALSLVVVPLFALTPMSSTTGLPFVLTMQAAFLHLAIATVGASALARERERGSLDVLLLTRLSSASIIWGALVGVARTCLPTFLLIAATVAAVAIRADTTFYHIAFKYFVVVTGYSATILATAVMISAAATRSSHAVTATVLVAVMHWFMPLPVGALREFWNTGGAAVGEKSFLLYIGGFTALLALATAAGVRLVIQRRMFPAAVVASVAVPLWLLLFAPTVGRRDDASLFWRWVYGMYGSQFSGNSWLASPATANAVANAYPLAAALIVLFTFWQADRLLGRMQARKGPAQSTSDATSSDDAEEEKCTSHPALVEPAAPMK
jgi:ABC-type transport system involved in multi-copper enzyme maturation permease subunit